METEFTWTISAMDCKVSEGELNDVVTAVHWRLLGSRDGVYADTYGVTSVGPPNPEDYTNYPDLTKETVVGWVETELGPDNITDIKNGLDTQIDNIITPVNVTLPPPFANN